MSYKDEISAMLAKMDKQENQGSQDKTQLPPEDIQDVYVLIVREHEDVAEEQAHIVDSTPPAAPVTQAPQAPAPVSAQPDTFLSAYIFVCFSLFLILATLAFQLYCLFNPAIATITIMPKSQTVTLKGTVQLGRLLPPITISQSATTPTTGHGHQDARAATGTVTFYNGLFTQQTVAQGSVYTGQDGVEVITTQYAIIPPGDPSTGYGTATVTAQALATRVTQLLTTQALKKLGSGYRLFGNMQVAVKQATITNAPPHLVFLSFQAHGTWMYGLSSTAQQHIKELIAGKTKVQAIHSLLQLPGVERVSIAWGDDSKLPNQSSYIQIILLVS